MKTHAVFFNLHTDSQYFELTLRTSGLTERLALYFADDTCLLSHTLKDIKNELSDLEKKAGSYGIKRNPNKIKL
jgi:hypothetical protein